MGDLGNIKADSKGVGFMCVKPSKVKLFGKVGGGAQLGDDLGRGCNEESLKTGIRGEGGPWGHCPRQEVKSIALDCAIYI